MYRLRAVKGWDKVSIPCIKQNHIQAEHIKRWGKFSILFSTSNNMTYRLRVVKGLDKVSMPFCTYPTKEHTSWASKSMTKSACWSTHIKPDYIQAEDSQRVDKVSVLFYTYPTRSPTCWGQAKAKWGQWAILHVHNAITYSLRAVKGRDEVSMLFCSCPTKSHTHWGQRWGE